jgi:HprK-related kinase B
MKAGELNIDRVVLELLGGHELSTQTVALALPGLNLVIRSNSDQLLQSLEHYFRHVVSSPAEEAIEIIAIECQPVDLGIEFMDWKREPGKTGRKDSYHDFPGGRLVRKVRTSMVFLQSSAYVIAAGPCLRNDNQVINFITSQYMNWLQQQGWLICHASGMVNHGNCLAMAGLSGGGKSTLMLKLMDDPDMVFLTNDRLFIKSIDGVVHARGIPKLPRINPGTIVHNPALHALIPAEQREALLRLPVDDLWHLEEKYDADIESLYGPDRIGHEALLSGFMILDWSRNSSVPLSVDRVDIREQPGLLDAIMKSPGPFYLYPDGNFHQDSASLQMEPYLEVLQDIKIYVARGRIDFDALAEYCLDLFLQKEGNHGK